ncbi:MAG TPA: NADH-quinone oxidoreductase subunit I [Thermoanaerobaculaceae bacterium]|nr:NADH-quinone oxidoreductase subunit I [Thermoanaerobaculaceae bacterium]HPS79403.1 NADH-quinone oxidoreductase subunit I [Thermoanaerobaculaceae bacterium]
MSLRKLLTDVFHLDLLGGLWQTARFTMTRKATVQYPEKRLEPAPRFRGMFGFSEERCIVCRACERACPIKIIYIDAHLEEIEVEGKKRKKQALDRYDIDVKRCMFCGLCQEACPTGPKAIWLTTRTYELATYERDLSLYFRKDRLQSWEGVVAYPGVVSPAEGQTPDDPSGRGGKERG